MDKKGLIMKKKEEQELYKELERIFNCSENVYKLSNLIKKYCDSKPDSDDLYEVSSLVEIINNNLTNMSFDLYRLIHKKDELLLIRNEESKIVGYINNNFSKS